MSLPISVKIIFGDRGREYLKSNLATIVQTSLSRSSNMFPSGRFSTGLFLPKDFDARTARRYFLIFAQNRKRLDRNNGFKDDKE